MTPPRKPNAVPPPARPSAAAARPRIRAAYKALRRNVLFLDHTVRTGLWPGLLGLRRPSTLGPGQARTAWRAALPRCSRPEELVAWLRARGVAAHEGRHVIYLPPQPALREIAPEAVSFYPAGSGFKLLKDFRPPERASYVGRRDRFAGRPRLLGTLEDRLAAANFLHWLGLGPRAWDVCSWKTGDSAITVFVVEHVAGEPASAEECRRFVADLREIVATTPLRILHPRWEECRDFRPPDANGNLFRAGDGLRYVDFQNFALVALPDEVRNWCTSAEAVDGERRWQLAVAGLCDHGIELRRRLVVDLGDCPEVTLRRALASEAAWAVGRVPEARLRSTSAVLFASRTSRFDLGAPRPDGEPAPGFEPRLRPLGEPIVFCGDTAPVPARWRALVLPARRLRRMFGPGDEIRASVSVLGTAADGVAILSRETR